MGADGAGGGGGATADEEEDDVFNEPRDADTFESSS